MLSLNTESERLKGFFALSITAVLWSTGGLAIKLVDWNPVAITGVRSAIAVAMLIAYRRRFRLPKTFSGWMAAVSNTLAMLTFVVANKLTASANVIFLQYLSPGFVAGLGIVILKEYPRRSDWLILCGLLGGMMLFFFDKLEPGETLGNVISIISGVFLALFIIFMKLNAEQGSKGRLPIDNFITGHTIAAVISLPFIIGSKAPDAASIGGLCYLGVIQIGLASMLFAFGVSRVTALSTAIITLLEPVLNPVWVYLFLGEIPTTNAMIGGVIIVVLVAVRSALQVRKPRSRTSSIAEK